MFWRTIICAIALAMFGFGIAIVTTINIREGMDVSYSVWQPLSGWAIGGFGIGLLSAIIADKS